MKGYAGVQANELTESPDYAFIF